MMKTADRASAAFRHSDLAKSRFHVNRSHAALRVPQCGEAGRYLCEFVALLRCALGLAGRIAQGKDDRPLVEGRHVSDDLLGECSCDRRHPLAFREQEENSIRGVTTRTENRQQRSFETYL